MFLVSAVVEEHRNHMLPDICGCQSNAGVDQTSTRRPHCIHQLDIQMRLSSWTIKRSMCRAARSNEDLKVSQRKMIVCILYIDGYVDCVSGSLAVINSERYNN